MSVEEVSLPMFTPDFFSVRPTERQCSGSVMRSPVVGSSRVSTIGFETGVRRIAMSSAEMISSSLAFLNEEMDMVLLSE